MDNNGQNAAGKVRFIDRARPNIVWIIIVFAVWYIFLVVFPQIIWIILMNYVQDYVSPEMNFTLSLYAGVIVDILTLFLLCMAFKKNQYIWKSFMLPGRLKGEGPDSIFGIRRSSLMTADDVYAALYGRGRNSLGMLGTGILLGFLTNFFCIVCALLHGDIKLYFDAGISQIPYFLFSLFCVCIQSTSEEWWCRGFLYERLHERYPLWVAVAVNGVLFGLLHLSNPGASVIPIVGIVICGFSYSLLRWYSGNIWIAMGIHTGWNFTQNFLFGLPNSGLVSEASIFHLDAATGISTLIYDWDFGVEGGLPALFIDGLLSVVIIVLAVRNGRIRELGMNRTQTLAVNGITIN